MKIIYPRACGFDVSPLLLLLFASLNPLNPSVSKKDSQPSITN